MGEDGGRKERSKGGNAIHIYKILEIDLKILNTDTYEIEKQKQNLLR